MYVTLLILYNFLNLFSCILTIFLGLFVVSAAHVQISLESRAKIKEINDGRKTWTKDDIYQSILQAKELDDAGFKYPRPFYNRDARQNPIFEAKGPFKEFPLTTPVWTSMFFLLPMILSVSKVSVES